MKVDISAILPQRPPFVMIEDFVSYSPETVVTALTVSGSNIFFEDGCLSAEGLMENFAQTCAARIGYINKYILHKDVNIGYIGAVKNWELKRLPREGEKVVTRIDVIQEIGPMVKVKAEARVGEDGLARGEMTIALSDIAVEPGAEAATSATATLGPAQKTASAATGPAPADLNRLVAHPDYAAAQALADSLLAAFAEGRYSQILLVYNHFVSTGSQKVVVESLLGAAGQGLDSDPVRGTARGWDADAPEAGVAPENMCHPRHHERGDHEVVGSSGARLFSGAIPASEAYLLEPGREEILRDLVPQVRRLKLFAAILDSIAAEHAARMIAMQAASDNAEDLLAELSLEYNKGRQAKITAEILDLVGGAQQ